MIIIDATSYELITKYNLPELTNTNVAIIRSTMYSVNQPEGKIMSTNIESVINGGSSQPWIHVGSFPAEETDNGINQWIANAIAVNQHLIYFLSNSNNLYVYDSILRTTRKVGKIEAKGYYTSFIVVNNVLYVDKDTHFYSFDGTNINEISTPVLKSRSVLFQMKNKVCRLGGNTTELLPDPVTCFNPADGTWSTETYIDEARWYPGVVTTKTGTCVFGGANMLSNGTGIWRVTSEIFNHETKTWSYIPSPITVDDTTPYATTFFF